MMARSGPIYEQSRRLSRIVSNAYRAAGRPRDVGRRRTAEGWTYFHRVTKGARRYELEAATEEEWRRWSLWEIERDRLRDEYGIHVGLGHRHRRLPD
jgi:hypothetical protein